ncbi:MAG: hypothetical protein ACOY4M_11250 [Pseudomonadota bacterium]
MPSEAMQEIRIWSDPRSFMTMYVAPLGGVAWVGGSAVMVYALVTVIFIESWEGYIAKMLAMTIIFALLLSGSLYYTLGAYQIFFLELRERFIARKVVYENGAFRLTGYYFKEAAFSADEVVSVEPVVVSERWFQKRLGTLLSRSTRFTIPHGKNVNLKIALRDGRTFYFPGEMGRPGQWKDEDVKELRDFMEGIVARNQT